MGKNVDGCFQVSQVKGGRNPWIDPRKYLKKYPRKYPRKHPNYHVRQWTNDFF